MKKLIHLISIFVLIIGISFAGYTSAGDDSKGKRKSDLGGQIFAISGDYLYDLFGIGAPFVNCYTFDEDLTPDDNLTSGVWNDPLFPVPGTWAQHTTKGKAHYTAVADDGAGLSLVQNGTVKGKGKRKLKAYTIVSVDGFGIIAEILSIGEVVEECPYEL